jgi:LPXTG-motif cell wall-anchored protein
LESNSEALPVSVTVPGGVIPNTDANKQLLPLGLGLSLSVGAASFLLRLRHVV